MKNLFLDRVSIVRFAFSIILIICVTALAFTDSYQGKEPRIVLLLNSTKSKTARYMYKDLSKGLRRLNVKAKIDIKSYSQIDAEILNRYDAVIAISEKHRETLDPKLLPFLKMHAQNPKLITVSFLPGRTPETLKTPEGIDALSSSSREDPAQNFVKKTLSTKVANLLKE